MPVSDFHLHGWDLSHYQPAGLNFASGGRVFVILKATEAVGVVDPNFAINRNRAHQQGMTAVGAYHFARPGEHSAADEASHFLATVGPCQPGEFAVLDYEVAPWSEGWAATWLNTVKAAGWPVVFYTYQSMLDKNPHGVIKATGAALWDAEYRSAPPVEPGWPWTFWQHTDGQASVSGNDGPYDCSVFYSNDLAELQRFVRVVPPPPLPTPDPQGTDDMLTVYSTRFDDPGDSTEYLLRGDVLTPVRADELAELLEAKTDAGKPAVTIVTVFGPKAWAAILRTATLKPA